MGNISKVPRVWLLCVMALLVIVSILVPLQTSANEGGVSDMSLYQRASELTREFGTALAPGSGVGELYMLQESESDGYLAAGNAGAFLGYADIMADDTGIIGWLMNSYTAASATISYDQLEHVIEGGSNGNSFYQYAGYGELLTEMGLISTIRGADKAGRIFATGAVLIVYMLANVAPFMFRGALMILTTLNPFKLFGTALTGTAGADLGMISGIAEYLSEIYETIQNFSLYILLPMILALTVVSVLMLAKGQAMKRFSRYALRVFMIFAGLPLIGATYTGLIEDMNTKVSVGSAYADYLVLSSYVDFENWVKYSRLAPPEQADLRNPRLEGEDATRSLSDRSLVLEINGGRANNTRAAALKDRYSATSDMSEIFAEGGATKNVDTQKMDSLEKQSFAKVYSLLTRHLTGTRYTSSDYNGEVSGQIQKIRASAGDDDEENIVKMFSLSSSENRTWSQKILPGWALADGKPPEWQEPIFWNGEEGEVGSSAKGLFTAGNAANPLFRFGKYDYNIYNAGDLRYSTGAGYTTSSMDPIVRSKSAPIGESREATVGGLSPIAMYNFLNTTFSNTGLTVYSPEQTSSDLSRDSYASVSFAGSGVSSWMRWFENLTVMLCMAALSIAFGFIMISVALTNIPRILSGVFGTALGSIAFITKLLISTAVLIIQVVGMIFLYTLSENIIMSMLLNFNELVDTGANYFGGGVIFEFLGSFMVIAITAAVTWFMIKNVKVFKELMEEVVSNSINRLMGALDTTTGGRGLDVADTTGGRVGSNGKLSDGAKQGDTLMGGAGLIGGAARMMGAAHDIEAKREQMLQENDKNGEMRNEDGSVMSFGDKVKNRLATGKDLAGAKGKDKAKDALGLTAEGKSYEREVKAKERQIEGEGLRGKKRREQEEGQDNANADGKNPVNLDKDGKPDESQNTNELGQAIDADGNVIPDANGNALNAQGRPISADAGLGVQPGQRPRVGADGTILDSEGNAYTDEMGNAFRQDEKGRLIDENGEYVALDKDGVLKPVTSIPGHNGKPMSGMREAASLEAKRRDADQFSNMKDAQAASHYGLDKDGNVVGADGEPMQARTPNGNVPVTMDRDGFVTDKDGNRMSARSMVGMVDPRGFEEVKDPETGETHLRHKGDAAMKNVAAGTAATTALGGAVKNKRKPSLTEMAKQSNRANTLAKGANERVAQLRANGASPYAIAQAERYADKANKNARVLQERFNGAMQAQGQNLNAEQTRRAEPVTKEQVTSAARFAQTRQAALQTETAKLDAMKASGEAPQQIARQERKVEAERASAVQSLNAAEDMQTASETGRTFNEVSQARNKAERAEQVFANAQQALDGAVKSKAPKQVIQQREQAVQKASQALSTAQANVSRVSQAPKGTRAEIDQAQAKHTQAQQQHAQASAQLKQLQHQGSPRAIQEAQVAERQAAQQVTAARSEKQQAERRVEQLTAQNAPRSEIVAARRDAERATTKAQAAQSQHAQATHRVQQAQTQRATPQQLQEAKRAEQATKRQVNTAAKELRSASNPPGWTPSAVPTVQPVPKVSQAQSFAALTSSGVSDYGDYSNKVVEQTAAVNAQKSQVSQAKQRLNTLRKSNRPPQIIREAEQQVQRLNQQMQDSEVQLNTLRDNAQGLLKNGKFQPMVASRPIRKNGGEIVNKMVQMGQTQKIFDKLTYQSERGVLSEAGKKQMDQLGGKLSGMRRELVSAGIKEDALRDSASLTTSTRHMQQSWEEFVNGTSKDQEE